MHKCYVDNFLVKHISFLEGKPEPKPISYVLKTNETHVRVPSDK